MKKIFLSLIIFIIIIAPTKIKAASKSDILINEVAWMGSANSANDEWIELFNNTDNQVDLSGWNLKSTNQKIIINLGGYIAARSFYLLERTDDNSVGSVKADLIYKGTLPNSGMHLILYDNLGSVINEINYSAGWPAGNNLTKQTMERTDAKWQTSKNTNGTPKAKNSLGAIVKINEPKLTQNNIKTYPSNIVINEILPVPDGSDQENEWIELYNGNNFSVNLQNWKIQDTNGTITNYILPENSNILANEYLVLKRTKTKITLNNDQDGLNLLTPNGKIANSIFYKEAAKNQSYNKIISQNEKTDWKWSLTTTPGSVNVINNNSTIQLLSKSKNSDNNMATASIKDSLSVSKNYNPWLLFLIALTITIISAGSILIIKLKISKKINNHERA